MKHRLLTLVCLAIAPALLGIDTLEYEGALYQVYRVPVLRQTKLQLRWLNDAGKPLPNFGALQKQLTGEGQKITFATNAGIYAHGPTPCGLTICEGKEQVPLNLAAGVTEVSETF